MIWVVILVLSGLTCFAYNPYKALHEWPLSLPLEFRPVDSSPHDDLPPFHFPCLQSPINIRSSLTAKAILPALEFEDLLSSNVIVNMENTGTTVEFDIADHSVRRPRLLGGPLATHGVFEFDNLHIHWGTRDILGAEHKINSRRFAIEGHCVHYNLKYGTFDEARKHSDGLAVIAFFGKAGPRDNPQIERLIRLLPNITFPGTSVTVTAKESLGWFAELGEPTNYFTYPGSLTTPPYSENVFWIVYPKPMYISSRQVEAFRNLLSKNLTILRENVRPIQAFNGRPLIFTV